MTEELKAISLEIEKISDEINTIERQIAATMFAPYYSNQLSKAKKVAKLSAELIVCCAKYEQLIAAKFALRMSSGEL